MIGETRRAITSVLWKLKGIRGFVEVDGSIKAKMNASLLGQKFCKTTACPSSEKLLGYRRRRLSIKDRTTIEKHLRGCDFCSAELQLLRRHRTEGENYRVVEMPIPLRRLAEDLLNRTRRLSRITDLTDRHQLSH